MCVNQCFCWNALPVFAPECMHPDVHMYVLCMHVCTHVLSCVLSEMLVKVFGCGGLRAYLREKQNIFDFIVVMTSLPSIIIPLSAGTFQQKSSLAAVSSFRVFRLFRVFRVARLLHKVKSMRNLLSAVLGSFSSLMNLLFFIAFALVTLSIAATSLFSRSLPPTPDVAQAVDSHGYSMYATGQSPRYNFDSFFNSFVSLFIIMSGNKVFILLYCTSPAAASYSCACSTCAGENWTDFFYYSMLIASPYVAILFQLFYFVFSNYVLLSLFIAIIVHNFDAKAEEREHQQRTAYSRVQELVRSKCN